MIEKQEKEPINNEEQTQQQSNKDSSKNYLQTFLPPKKTDLTLQIKDLLENSDF